MHDENCCAGDAGKAVNLNVWLATIFDGSQRQMVSRRLDETYFGRYVACGGTGVHEPGMVSCLFRIVPLQEIDSCSEIALGEAVIAAAL